uniref:Uncharacterized protein n=1 Tax=Cucumis sativus TaxID=3659 RepID=A0A0A0L997_CUCSA
MVKVDVKTTRTRLVPFEDSQFVLLRSADPFDDAQFPSDSTTLRSDAQFRAAPVPSSSVSHSTPTQIFALFCPTSSRRGSERSYFLSYS